MLRLRARAPTRQQRNTNKTSTHLADVVAGLEDEAALAHEHLPGEGQVAVKHLGP